MDATRILCSSLLLGLSCSTAAFGQNAQPNTVPPHLEKHSHTTQLIVDGAPYLMLSGELHNSSSSSLEYMQTEWPRLAEMNINTVLTPVSWAMTEPAEGHYDFALLDGLLAQARERKMHMVLLWLAAWKNGMSGYAPTWVKQDTQRFPRVVENHNPVDILSTFGPAIREADATAFKALMQHLREVDTQHTVLMIQVENEVGVLGASRDHSAPAERAFAADVPPVLLQYMAAHRSQLNIELRTLWEAHGAKTSGTWTEVFGDTTLTDEIFMAWQYAQYVQSVAAEGKAVNPLPMYANAWLGGGDTPPGNYPSGGPQPRVIDVWKAAGSALDMLCPDLYAADFADWATRYHRPDNPLFIPETKSGDAGAAAVFYAVGEQDALGFSPFGIDAGMHGESSSASTNPADGDAQLAASYKLLAQLQPELAAAQERGDVHGFVLDKTHPEVDFVMHGATVHVSLDQLFGYHAENGYGLILQEGPNQFLGAGKGFRVSFTPRDPGAPIIGIASIVEGQFLDGSWAPGRTLNGDEADQGENWRFAPFAVTIERATTYQAK